MDHLNTALNFIEHFAVTLWFGSVVFFSFFVAPVLFRALGQEQAGRAVRAIFPRYYLLGIVCGVLMVAVHLARGFLYYWGGMTKPAIVLFALLTLINIYARQDLTPDINAARDAGAPMKARFDALHRRSVLLNSFVLICGVAYHFWIATRGF